MPLHSASYFAGVGTVVATMAIGFGGGVVLTDAFVGKSEKTPTLMERRAAPLAESTPVVASAPAPAQQAESQQAAAPAAPQPPVIEQQVPQQAAVSQKQPAPQQAAVRQTTLQAQQPAMQPLATNVQGAPQGQAQFEDSKGQVREVDLKRRDADAKRAASAERRKQERRKWAERRKREMDQIDELTAVTEKVKQIERPRERDPVRSYAAESRPPAPPLFRLFGNDDDD